MSFDLIDRQYKAMRNHDKMIASTTKAGCRSETIGTILIFTMLGIVFFSVAPIAATVVTACLVCGVIACCVCSD